MISVYIWDKHVERVAEKVTGFLGTKVGKEKLYAEYALKVLLGEFEKIILLSAIFIVTGYGKEYLYAFLTIMFLRVNTGGIHRKTNIGCFFHTLVALLVIIYMGLHCKIGEKMVYAIFAWMFILVLLSVPIQSENRIRYSKRQRGMFKCKAVMVLGLVLLLKRFVAVPYYHIMVYAVFVLSMELTYLGVRKYKRREETEDERDEKGN